MSERHGPVVAAFDLDGTLTDGGSVFSWLGHIAGRVRVYWSATLRSPAIVWAALRSGAAADRVKESLFRAALAGRDEDAVAEESREFALEHLARHGREEVIERLRRHREHGDKVVIVSASPELYVATIAEALEADGQVATRLAVDPLGRLTGGYLGHNCRGEEKLRRLQLWIADQGLGDDVVIYAYGNSRGDRRMLSAANVGVDCGRLGVFGALRRYTRLRNLDQ
jgi:phosphatidylglycerophosphatase C